MRLPPQPARASSRDLSSWQPSARPGVPLVRSPLMRRLTCPRGSGACRSRSLWAHLTLWAPFRVRASCPYPASYAGRLGRASGGVPVPWCLLGCRHSLLGHPVPAAELGLPCGRLTPRRTCRAGTSTGLPRSTRTRCDRVGCCLYPGTAVSSRLTTGLQSAPAASQRPVLNLAGASHLTGLYLTRRTAVH
jgi:hypothetical protein